MSIRLIFHKNFYFRSVLTYYLRHVLLLRTFVSNCQSFMSLQIFILNLRLVSLDCVKKGKQTLNDKTIEIILFVLLFFYHHNKSIKNLEVYEFQVCFLRNIHLIITFMFITIEGRWQVQFRYLLPAT